MSPAADLSRGQATGHLPAWPRRRPVVSAVIVAHDGARWLPRLLATLEGQTRLPDRLVAVDTGSRDDTPGLLVRALGPEAVVTTGRDVGFAATPDMRVGMVSDEGGPAASIVIIMPQFVPAPTRAP